MSKNSPWVDRIQNIINTAQDELKRTTSIGKKMISAGKTNTTMKDTLEEIGQLAVDEIRSGRLQWENPRIKEYLEVVQKCEKDLETIEDQVNTLKKTEITCETEKEISNSDKNPTSH